MMIKINEILDAEKYLEGIDGVIFDLDDTLYSEKEYVKSGYRAVSKLFQDSDRIYKALLDAFEHKKAAIDSVLDAEQQLQMKEQALHIYRFHRPDITLYDGVKDMICRLRANKKVGIITDGRPEGQQAKLEALHIEVDEVIITDELGGVEFRKPNEAAFRLMQKKFGISFDKMVYIGDNIKKDFIAPEKLGMKIIYFQNPDGLY